MAAAAPAVGMLSFGAALLSKHSTCVAGLGQEPPMHGTNHNQRLGLAWGSRVRRLKYVSYSEGRLTGELAGKKAAEGRPPRGRRRPIPERQRVWRMWLSSPRCLRLPGEEMIETLKKKREQDSGVANMHMLAVHWRDTSS